MRLEISNIGRVGRADIEIQRITVVAGENGTGKSTVSKSLYAVLEMSNGAVSKAELQKRRSFRNCIISWKEKNVPFFQVTKQTFLKKVEELYKMAEGKQDIFVREMTGFLKENRIELFLNEQKIQKELLHLFDSCTEITCRDLDYYCSYLSQVVLSDVFENQINCLKNNQEGVITYIKESVNTKIRILNHKIKHMDMLYDADSAQPVYITTPDLMDSVGTYKKLYSAERFKTISYANSQLTKLLLKEKNSKLLVAEDYNKIEEQKQRLQNLFEEVLEGEIYMEGNQIAYYDRWCENNIELSNIASGMKIFLILQSLVANGTFLEHTCLVIDEPETNLHPEWQLKLAHLLVLLNMNLGIQVYLNSHSPYFVRAVEYYANQYQILEQCNFYIMKKDAATSMCQSENVTDKLGAIYDKMAEPFQMIM